MAAMLPKDKDQGCLHVLSFSHRFKEKKSVVVMGVSISPSRDKASWGLSTNYKKKTHPV